MEVNNIRIAYNWEDIDSENDNLDIFVEMDDGYTYTISVATPQNYQFLMDKEKMDYQNPRYPCIIVNKLTPKTIEQAVKAFAKKDEGYWLKLYTFGGFGGFIDESIFDQLKAKTRKELD
jgi:hypothetical protein